MVLGSAWVYHYVPLVKLVKMATDPAYRLRLVWLWFTYGLGRLLYRFRFAVSNAMTKLESDGTLPMQPLTEVLKTCQWMPKESYKFGAHFRIDVKPKK